MDFATLLSKISTGAQIAQAVTPEIQQYGADHVAATQQILKIAGAGVAARNLRQERAGRSVGLGARPPPAWFRWRLSCSPPFSTKSQWQRRRQRRPERWPTFRSHPFASRKGWQPRRGADLLHRRREASRNQQVSDLLLLARWHRAPRVDGSAFVTGSFALRESCRSFDCAPARPAKKRSGEARALRSG